MYELNDIDDLDVNIETRFVMFEKQYNITPRFDFNGEKITFIPMYGSRWNSFISPEIYASNLEPDFGCDLNDLLKLEVFDFVASPATPNAYLQNV